MTAKGLKRLDLWIPESHPIYSYPPYSRARVAREWLNIGAHLTAIEQELRDLKARLLDVDPAKETNSYAGQGKSAPGDSVSIDDFI
jgi:hypothetical protein